MPDDYDDEEEHGFSRRTDPPTSHDAGRGLKVTPLEDEVFAVLKRYGPPKGPPMCVVEIWQRLPHLSIDTVSPRMARMCFKGLIYCWGKEPRSNRYGNIRQQLVYAVIPPDDADATVPDDVLVSGAAVSIGFV